MGSCSDRLSVTELALKYSMAKQTTTASNQETYSPSANFLIEKPYLAVQPLPNLNDVELSMRGCLDN